MKEEKKEQQKIEEKKEEPSVAPTSAEVTADKKATAGRCYVPTYRQTGHKVAKPRP